MGWESAAPQNVYEEYREIFYGDERSIKLVNAFELFDVNKDGSIDANELQSLLTSGGGSQDTKTISVDDCKSLITDMEEIVGKEKDGKFQIPELVAAWRFIGCQGNDGVDAAIKEQVKRNKEKVAAYRKKKQAQVQAKIDNARDEAKVIAASLTDEAMRGGYT